MLYMYSCSRATTFSASALYHSTQQWFRPVVQQRHSEERKRPLPPVRPRKRSRPEQQLVHREVEIPVRSSRHSVHPVDPWIPHEQTIGPICWVEEGDGVLLEIAVVDEVVGIGLHSISNPSLAVIVDRALC